MLIGVIPKVLQIDTIEDESYTIFFGDNLISNFISIVTVEEFLIIGVDLWNECEIESLFTELEQTFIVRFDIHINK